MGTDLSPCARFLQNAFAYCSLTYARIKRRIIRELCPVRTSLPLLFFSLSLPSSLCEQPLKALRRTFLHASFLSPRSPPTLLFLPFFSLSPWIFHALRRLVAGERATHANEDSRRPTEPRYLIDSPRCLLFGPMGWWTSRALSEYLYGNLERLTVSWRRQNGVSDGEDSGVSKWYRLRRESLCED